MYLNFFNFFVYGFLGWCTEVAYAAFKEKRFVNRGFLNGPICPVYGFGVSIVVLLLAPFKGKIIPLYIISTLVVTALEWITGFLLEKLFHSRWWDYSHQPLNLNGYVCLLFSLIWGVACVVIVQWIHPVITKGILLLPHLLGTILLVVFTGAILVDLYVTASSILKLNRHLEKMEQIACELHSISDEIGENIYRNVVDTLEFGEEQKKKWEGKAQSLEAKAQEKKESVISYKEELSTETIDRIRELKRKYAFLSEHPTKAAKRITKAFPNLHSNRHHERWQDIKSHFKNQ